MVTKLEATILFFLFGALLFLLSVGMYYFFPVGAAAGRVVYYRVVSARTDSMMEEKINIAAHDGCKPMFAVDSDGDSEPMVVLRCW